MKRVLLKSLMPLHAAPGPSEREREKKEREGRGWQILFADSEILIVQDQHICCGV